MALIKVRIHEKSRLSFLIEAERMLVTWRRRKIREFVSSYSVKKKKKSKAEKERTKRGRRTRAAHPAEMRLGSNRILYVGKQEAADVVRVLRTLLEHITYVCARVELRFSRLHDATLTHKWAVNRRIIAVSECKPKGWNSSATILFFMQRYIRGIISYI